MLVELRIRNFAIIEGAALYFGPGFNVLSGETGAGKTIIMTALGLLLGSRASPDMIRAGQNEAVVEGMFELEGEAPLPEGTQEFAESSQRELVIRRTLAADGGRSRAYVNGEIATVQTLSRMGQGLVQVYGQHEHQTLLRSESHLQLLDRHAALDATLEEYDMAYRATAAAHTRAGELRERERTRAEQLELARFRVAELERAGLAPGEDEQLAAERTVLANAARLGAAAVEAEQMLAGESAAALDTVARTEARVGEAAAIDPKLKDALELIRSARLGLEEAAHTLRDYAARLEADPARLEEIETRMAELVRLKRKYGGSLASVLETLERARAEIAELERVSDSRAEAEAELGDALDNLARMGAVLSARRQSAAAELKRRMETELKTLGMRVPVFEARFAPLEKSENAFEHNRMTLGPAGADAVEFMLSPNLGQPPMALARIASGGELSRVMLALKRLEAQRRGVATMIFDEVDAGVGGAVAQVVGRKLKELARFHQVLCVTHLPQVAAFADTHFLIEKEERRGATRSRVSALAQAERIEEVARMLGGAEVTDKFRRAARELIDRARA
ncbi:MAG: DNA repair protein RecN [Candidatus Binataceae bacterium]